MPKLLVNEVPILKGRFRPGVDENNIGANAKFDVDILCFGKGCKKYVPRRPSNIIRTYKLKGTPNLFCDDPACQAQKVKPKKRKVKSEYSLKNKMPELAKRLFKGYDAENISYMEESQYPFHCLCCNEKVMISPRKIKETHHSEYASYCEEPECQQVKKVHRKGCTDKRGSYKKLAKEGESFADLNPNLAAKQHESCKLDLNILKPKSNETVIYACEQCGDPISLELGKSVNYEHFYCDNNDKCAALKKLTSQRKDWKTRIAKVGSFADKNPEFAKEWVRCISHPGVTADEVPPSATVEVEWRCKDNPKHVYISDCDARNNHSGCPMCQSNISRKQLRFASELEGLLNVEATHSKKFNIHDKKVEIDIAFTYQDVKYAIEVDGYEWHREKFDLDQEKNNLLSDEGWITFRVRDDRLQSLGELQHSQNFYVSSNEFYKAQWMESIVKIVEIISGKAPQGYDAFVAQDRYLELKSFFFGKSATSIDENE